MEERGKRNNTSRDERKRWIKKVLEIAEREGVDVLVVEDYYDNGPLIRFKCPGNPEKGAGVYVWYRKVEIFSELRTTIKSDYAFSLWKMDFVDIIKENIGYEEYQNYDGFVKEVETPDEAICEVKSLLDKRIWEIEKDLIEAYESIRGVLRGVEYRLAPEKKKSAGGTISISVCSKTPEWVVKELMKKKNQDKKKP